MSGPGSIDLEICNGQQCCSLTFEPIRSDHRYTQSNVCRNIAVTNQDQLFIKYTSRTSGVKPNFVYVHLENGASYSLQYNQGQGQQMLPMTRLFNPRLHNRINKVCPGPREPTCALSNLVIYQVFQTTWKKDCRFTCDQVASIDPQSVGKGISCLDVEEDHPQVAYCCTTGPVGTIPGCYQATNNPDNFQQPLRNRPVYHVQDDQTDKSRFDIEFITTTAPQLDIRTSDDQPQLDAINHHEESGSEQAAPNLLVA